MFIHATADKRQQHPSKEAGFTLVEIMIALAILTIMAVVLFPLFSQTINYSQTTTTRAHLNELVKGLKVAYEKDAMVVDTTGADGDVVFTSNWGQVLGAPNDPLGTATLTSGSTTVNPVQAYALGNQASLESGFYAIAGAAGTSPLSLATDGYGNPFWVYVSPEMEGHYDGYPVYYHDVAFLSTNGAPSSVTPASQGVTYTCTVNPTYEQSGCSLNLGTNGGQHDAVATFSGYAVEQHLYHVTLRKMKTVGDAYGAYFTTQYLANASRNADIDYFANIDTAWNGCGPGGTGGNAYMDTSSPIPNSGNGSNSGPSYYFPGENPDGSTASYYGTNFLMDVQPATWDNNAFINNLGLSLPSVTSAWGFLMGIGNGPNSSNYGNGEPYTQNRDPLSCNTNMQSPPYTAFILAWAPNTVLLSIPVVGNY
ncbi:type II secretion system protein [Acidithiobacillus ferridurans]|uniref:Prepilin-type N-terminal cleavage/methylation domain-containing protein n=1 Tax=Acidithiobacillus ferridurans TaxID=1232575 RepID=A0A8X8GAR8_ACIFI|nr:prepilin-type N-terminal cleavage/methylation domain-containing protein [Acidithiobacillus ferridurans]MBU2716703.1 prepilin-type N-terminal cleavage/methylation domain-containing protein [Acidithiobacillus ferridurans]MBU2723810.1 prepilin-type N-terminal cleavage/methylation domain-containing protein [Acidithiobacillus ferridurans]MBU2725429.1 prepilin-type N-terminal cleavage/methylation domain-containing protein [Acidithiobacillus ferridurans]